MTISGSIYFLGAYRPAYFEADTIEACAALMHGAVQDIKNGSLKIFLLSRIKEGRAQIARDNCSAWSAEHRDRGVSFAKRPHDPFLDRVTATLPHCPGLDYAGTVGYWNT